MKVYVAINHDIEHSDVLGVYRTYRAAHHAPGGNSVEAFDLDDVDEGDGRECQMFRPVTYGRASGAPLCWCGDTEAQHVPHARSQPAEAGPLSPKP